MVRQRLGLLRELSMVSEALAVKLGGHSGRRLWSLVSLRRSGFDSRYDLLGASSAAFFTSLHAFGY